MMREDQIRQIAEDGDVKRIIGDMTNKGYTMEQMRPRAGLPYEVIDRHRKDAQDKKRAEKKRRIGKR